MFFFLSSTSPIVLWTIASCFFMSPVTPVPASRRRSPWPLPPSSSSPSSRPSPCLPFLPCRLARPCPSGLLDLLLLELAGRDFLGLLDRLVADQLGHLQHVHVVVDERERRERLQVVAVEREHGAQVADRLADVVLLLFGARRLARLVAQDLRDVVARLDAVERIVVDRPREQRLGPAGLVVLPGDVAEVGDRGAVLQPFPDARRFVVTAALVEHRALVEARLEQPGVVVGDALERVRRRRSTRSPRRPSSFRASRTASSPSRSRRADRR